MKEYLEKLWNELTYEGQCQILQLKEWLKEMSECKLELYRWIAPIGGREKEISQEELNAGVVEILLRHGIIWDEDGIRKFNEKITEE